MRLLAESHFFYNTIIKSQYHYKEDMMEFISLRNGVQMPMLGFGVYQIPPEDCARCVKDALSAGYRSFDTAQAYHNEEGVGEALASSGIARDQLFLTTKIWLSNGGEKKAAASIDESLKKLRTDYVDLLLIHQPFNDYYGTWRAMEKALAAGKARAIGVSNFYPDRLIDLCTFADTAPMVDQVETHLFQQQPEAHKVMQKYGVVHEAWAPFAEGRNGFFQNSLLHCISQKYGKTPAQTALRFLIQSGVAIIPKSTHLERMKENLDVFDFTLSPADMEALRSLDTGKSLFFSHYDPAAVEFITGLDR